MTVPQFSRPGAIDLSALRRPPGTASATGGGGSSAAAGGGYTIDITSEQSLRSDVVERSMSAVVLVSFWSPQVPASVEINAVLSKLADEYAGRFLFARLDIEGQPDLAQALGIPQVPLVVAALRGQLAPLIQEPLPEPEMRALVDQILQSAAANGVAGTVEPAGPTSGAAAADEPAEEPVSRFPDAEAALLSGDLDAAIKGYEEGLLSSPGDPEASLGLSQAKLLKRTQGVDPTGAREAAASRPDDVEAQQLAADLDLLGGNVEDAFGRLIDLVRRISGDERDRAREHLIEMFGVVGDDDPRVAKARQRLASALF
jgi:putative thioredoxin